MREGPISRNALPVAVVRWRQIAIRVNTILIFLTATAVAIGLRKRQAPDDLPTAFAFLVFLIVLQWMLVKF